MAERDITEKSLEWFNDVFADIVNAWFKVNGVEGFTVLPDELQDARTESVYKSGGGIRDLERDVAKLWSSETYRAVICLIGFENQTAVDTNMALRVLGYDGGDYRAQLSAVTEDGKRKRKKPHPVVTLVLYFGTRHRWPKRRSLMDRLAVPAELRRFCSDTPLNVFELAFLTEDQEGYFKSDFRYVVRLLRQERLGEKFDMPPGEVWHAVELMELFFSLTGDANNRDAIKKAQDMEKSNAVLAAAETGQDAVAILNHGIIDDGMTGQAADLFEQQVLHGSHRQRRSDFSAEQPGEAGGAASRPGCSLSIFCLREFSFLWQTAAIAEPSSNLEIISSSGTLPDSISRTMASSLRRHSSNRHFSRFWRYSGSTAIIPPPVPFFHCGAVRSKPAAAVPSNPRKNRRWPR